MKPTRLFASLPLFLFLIASSQLASAQLCHARTAGQQVACDCQACSSACQTEEIICGCGQCQAGCFDKCPRPRRRLLDRCDCPECGNQFEVPQEYCDFKVTDSTEERTCFKTEQKTVCIPPVTFPWQKCGPVRCAKTRSVKVLTTHKFKCPVCKYSWEVKKCEVAQATVEQAAEISPPLPVGITSAIPIIQPVGNR